MAVPPTDHHLKEVRREDTYEDEEGYLVRGELREGLGYQVQEGPAQEAACAEPHEGHEPVLPQVTHQVKDDNAHQANETDQQHAENRIKPNPIHMNMPASH
jgi:hypothetical protein